MSRLHTISLLLFVSLASTGCNIDRVFSLGQDRDAPMTSFDRPAGVDIPDIVVLEGNEVDMVEQVLANRAVYKRSLEALRDFYNRRGSFNKQQWAETELKELSHVRPFKYILSAEVPAKSLTPSRSIAEADRMYDEGLDLMRKGGHGVPALFRRDYMHDAMGTFTQMIARYPSSDKIDDAAFSCGEILKEYYENQERLALQWYQRAREWDPQTPHPVLFQSAVVYDYRLHDRARALELYHRVLKEETQNRSNTAFASRRVHELTTGIEESAFREPRYSDQSGQRSWRAPRQPAYEPAQRSQGSDGFNSRSDQSTAWRTGQQGDGIARSRDPVSEQSSYDRYGQSQVGESDATYQPPSNQGEFRPAASVTTRPGEPVARVE
ncbi:MAG: hypothetical protein GXP29_02830, partial [Planctomycetes bacterium]|nr:hypothetical protein [Planctomycetota bacterium]